MEDGEEMEDGSKKKGNDWGARCSTSRSKMKTERMKFGRQNNDEDDALFGELVAVGVGVEVA